MSGPSNVNQYSEGKWKRRAQGGKTIDFRFVDIAYVKGSSKRDDKSYQSHR